MSVILALYPNSRGFGYACLETSDYDKQRLLDSGIINVRPVGNEKVLKHVRRFTEYFKPKIIILRDYHQPTMRGRRIRDLLDDISRIAAEKNLEVYGYTRQQVKYAFEQYGAKTKYEIAQKIIDGFPELIRHAPRIRKLWENEEYHMGVFDSLALALTHLYLKE